MKRMSKIVSFILIVITIISLGSTVFAAVSGVGSPANLQGKSVTGTAGITNIGNQLITIISIIGTVTAVIVLIVLGLKYMMGSAEEKAEYKKTLMPYVIGAVLVFAASAIAGVLYNFISNISVS